MPTTFNRAPFQIVDDGFTLRIRNADRDLVQDVMVTILAGDIPPSEPIEHRIATLGPGEELMVPCAARVFPHQRTHLEVVWRGPGENWLKKSIAL